MEWAAEYFVICSIIIIWVCLKLLQRRERSYKQLPPGPPGWPIFGNMFDLGTMPHRTLAELRHQYGDVIWLKFGAINTMAILSTRAATDFFKHHDLSFAERKVTETMRVYDYHKSSLALAPYGSFWRVLRRLVTVEMLVNKRINETASIRRKCVDNMLEWIIEQRKEESRGIHVARFVFLSTFNLLGNLMLSRDLLDPESKDGAEFFAAMMGSMEWSGHANMADFFPWLRWLDPQGLKRKMRRDLGKALEIASKFVKERMEGNEDKRNDFLDVLLEFQANGNGNVIDPPIISEQDLNIFILVSV